MAIVGLDKHSNRIEKMLNSSGDTWKVLVNRDSNGWIISCKGYTQKPIVDIWRTARLVTEFADKMLNAEWERNEEHLFEYEVQETYIEVYAKE